MTEDIKYLANKYGDLGKIIIDIHLNNQQLGLKNVPIDKYQNHIDSVNSLINTYFTSKKESREKFLRGNGGSIHILPDELKNVINDGMNYVAKHYFASPDELFNTGAKNNNQAVVDEIMSSLLEENYSN